MSSSIRNAKHRTTSPRRRDVHKSSNMMFPDKSGKYDRVGNGNGRQRDEAQSRCLAYVNQRRKVIACVGIAMAMMLYAYGGTVKRKFGLGKYSGVPREIEVATWNVAAINNNPFEYWVTMDDNPKYNKMMDNVQEFINSPGKSNDVQVSKVFTQSMFAELVGAMKHSGMDKDQVDIVKQMWNKDYSKRHIVSGFLLDPVLGLKRLVSMPDRISNTITLTNGQTIYRPAVIDCYSNSALGSVSEWWTRWQEYMFVHKIEQEEGSALTVAQMLQPIVKAKYPAITETEESVSIPLQTLVMGIFDAILVHMVNKVEPEWASIRTSICEALNLRKNEHTLDIINTEYGDQDVFFMQEVGTGFISTLKNDERIGASYTVVEPAKLGKRDQNSIILLRKSLFNTDTLVEHTTELNFGEGVKAPVSSGDVLVITVDDRIGNKLMFASFHGDTNGLATIPVVTAVHNLAQSMTPRPMLIFGLDANTYQHSKPGKTQDVLDFAKTYRSMGLTSCWGDTPDPGTYTTFNGRTYLQPQLNKAAKKEEVRVKGDVNPKDFILFYKGDLSALRVARDNTGQRKYVEDMVFPTLTFPSDHGVLSATLA
jgi:hypothetical protein